MTVCPYCTRLPQFLDRQFSEEEHREIELHVETCLLCGKELERLTVADGADLLLPPVQLGDATPPDPAPAPDEELPAVPGYQVLRVLGKGGQKSIVYLAEDRLRRRVALKMILAGSGAGPRDLTRFRIQAEALARLQHPNIVPIHEVGNYQGRPLLAMDYVDGGSLKDRLEEGLPLPRDAAQLAETLARAMHYAHQHAVLHRDLTPANVLLASGGGTPPGTGPGGVPPPLAEFTPKIIDFGLAKFLDVGAKQTCITGSYEILGTPGYMAPEQAAGTIKEVGTLTDVYGLGAVLYDMLTGHAPFEGDSILEIVNKTQYQAVAPPRRGRPEVPADLEAICLKCLEKEPARRYTGAEQLADELRHFLRGEPLAHTRRVGRGERLWRWCRRNPGLAAVSGLAVMLLVMTAGIAVAWALHASRLAADVQAALDESERRRAENHLDRGLAEAERGDVGLGLLWMAHGLETVPPRADNLARTIRANLTGWRRQLFALTDCRTPPGEVLGFSPDGQSAWTVDKNVVRRWELARGQYAGPALPHPKSVTALAVSPDGRLVGTGCSDGTVRLWDAVKGQVERALPGKDVVCALAFSPDSRRVLTGRREQKDSKVSTAFQAWETATGQPLARTFHRPGQVGGLAFSPDGLTLLGPGGLGNLPDLSKTVGRWEMPTGRFLGVMLSQPGAVRAVAYSPDGRTILTGGDDQTARLWETASGRLLEVLYHRKPVLAVAFGPDGRTLLTASPGDAVRVWEGTPSPEPLQILHYGGPVRALAVSPDGTRVVTGSDDRIARVWDMTSERLVLVRELPHASALASATFSRDGKLLATSTHLHNDVLLWEVTSGRLLAQLRHRAPVRMMTFSPDGTRVATASYDWTARLWDTATGQPALDRALGHDGAVVAVAFSPDGGTLLTGGEDHCARRWDAATGAPLGQPLRHGSTVLDVAFSPDGRMLLTGSGDGTARRWDTEGTPKGPAFEHGDRVWAVAFSPDGGTILTGSWDHTARLWDARTGERRTAPLRHAGHIRSVAFSPDGQWIVTASEDGTARVWDTSTGTALGPPLPHDDIVFLAAIGPDQRWIVTVGRDGTVRLWPTPAPLEAAVPQVILQAQVLTGMELDPSGGVQVLDAATWHQRRQRLQELDSSPVP